MLLLVIVEDGLLILALIGLMVLRPVVPCILVVLLSNVILFTRAEIAGDYNDVVHSSGGLKLIIDSLVLIVLV